MTSDQIQGAADEIIGEISELTGLNPTAAAIALALLVGIALFIFLKPIRMVIKLAVNTAVGFAVLFIINKLGANYGIDLGITPVNAVVTGVFGVPGVAVLLVLKWMGIM